MKSPLAIAATVPLLLALSACKPAEPDAAATTPPTTAAATQTPGHSSAPGQAAVWNGSLDECRKSSDADPTTCLLASMRQQQASPEAIALTQQLIAQDNPGYLSGWAQSHGIGIATLEYPYRANTNTGTWLVDSQGHTVDVDDDVLPETSRHEPAIQSFLATHPDSSPFATADADGNAPLADDGIRLIYATPLRTCRACDTDGYLQVGYDFDRQRRFIGKQVLGITAPATPQ